MTILDDNRYIAENFYRQYTQRKLYANETWEIELELGIAPTSKFWWLVIEPNSTDTREEVFYHRTSWTSIFIYAINRTWAKYHENWSMVVLTNTAWIYNFKEKDNDNIYFSYQTSDTDLEILWWVIVDINSTEHIINNTNTSTLSLTKNLTSSKCLQICLNLWASWYNSLVLVFLLLYCMTLTPSSQANKTSAALPFKDNLSSVIK